MIAVGHVFLYALAASGTADGVRVLAARDAAAGPLPLLFFAAPFAIVVLCGAAVRGGLVRWPLLVVAGAFLLLEYVPVAARRAARPWSCGLVAYSLDRRRPGDATARRAAGAARGAADRVAGDGGLTGSLASPAMSWHWRLEDPAGAAIDPATIGVEIARDGQPGRRRVVAGGELAGAARPRRRHGHPVRRRRRGLRPDGARRHLTGGPGPVPRPVRRRRVSRARSCRGRARRRRRGPRRSASGRRRPACTPAALTLSCTCSGRLAPMIAAATFAVLQHPGDGELGHRQAEVVGDRAQLLHARSRIVVGQEAAASSRPTLGVPGAACRPAAARPAGTCR